MLRLIRNLVVLLAVAIGVAFGYLNYNSTPIDLLWTHARAPLSMLLGLAFALGLVVALIVASWPLVRLRARLAGTRRRLKHAEAELARLRVRQHPTGHANRADPTHSDAA